MNKKLCFFPGHQIRNFIPALIRRAVEKHDPFVVWGDGMDLKDFLEDISLEDTTNLEVRRREAAKAGQGVPASVAHGGAGVHGQGAGSRDSGRGAVGGGASLHDRLQPDHGERVFAGGIGCLAECHAATSLRYESRACGREAD